MYIYIYNVYQNTIIIFDDETDDNNNYLYAKVKKNIFWKSQFFIFYFFKFLILFLKF